MNYIMDNNINYIMDNNINYVPINNIIRGSYISDIYNSYCDVNKIKHQYIEEKNNLEKQMANIELINIDLLQNIHSLNRRCYFINVTHNNTINFIIANYINLKKLLDDLISNYNNNVDKMKLLKQKLQYIELTIDKLK